jgi:hypothetical protein
LVKQDFALDCRAEITANEIIASGNIGSMVVSLHISENALQRQYSRFLFFCSFGEIYDIILQ